MTVPSTALEVHLASRPTGFPTPDDFALVEAPVPTPGPGQLLVRNTFMSVDPYMRGRMNDAKSYVPPFALGAVLEGGAVGEVLVSDVPGIAVGDTVAHFAGWREYAVVGDAVKVDPEVAPVSTALGVLGMPGLTAYAGLLDVAAFREGDTVFVSGAAGAVGQVAGQVARLRGAKRVIGSAGSAEKVAYLVEELGFDAAFDYHDGDVRDLLAAAAPEGVDVYFDNTGGPQLEAALASANLYARFALCGAISNYNTDQPAGPRNLSLAVGKRVTLRGFLVRDHEHLRPAFEREVGGWVRDGSLRHRETITTGGLANAPAAFIGMLRGENIGKALVAL
ncbi:NADP-dependent oxidoreductase [Actinosynnema sp. NPDC020468]|uniref:NADP-dependent oxidoreductase n=1 Tax=Actinosynnema sp. NPDC020468 TaxID=3154488 RepID=UPI0033CF66C3